MQRYMFVHAHQFGNTDHGILHHTCMSTHFISGYMPDRMCSQPSDAYSACNTHTTCRHKHVPHAWQAISYMPLLTAFEAT